ncbi:MAG TPA: hypothetical protein VD816_13275, partial [Ohtaekwangia sp.]|nr:hypothetical protein [Ohtaekwangia sp.]
MTSNQVRKSPHVGEERKKRNQFTIPVFPHVKKFILKNYQVCDPIKIEEYNILGKSVTLALRETRSLPGKGYQVENLTASITVVLTSEQSKLGPRISKLIRINVDMDRLFKEHLLSWIYALKTAGIPPFTACKMFLEHFSIDEKEYSLDAAYKYWQRTK